MASQVSNCNLDSPNAAYPSITYNRVGKYSNNSTMSVNRNIDMLTKCTKLASFPGPFQQRRWKRNMIVGWGGGLA